LRISHFQIAKSGHFRHGMLRGGLLLISGRVERPP